MDEPDQKKPLRLTTYVEDGNDGYVWESVDTAVDWSKPFVADDPAKVEFDAHWLHWSTARTWPVHLAVAWAASPSRAEIVGQGQKPTTFPREREARAEVIAALIAGRLVAYGVPDPGTPWDPTFEIPAETWRGLDLRDSRTLSEPALNRGRGGKVAFRNVEVETSRLFALWPDASAETVAQGPEAPQPVDVPAADPSRGEVGTLTAATDEATPTSGSQKGPLRGDALPDFVRQVGPPPGLSKDALFHCLQMEAKKIGRTAHRPSVRGEIHGSDIYPDVASRGRPQTPSD